MVFILALSPAVYARGTEHMKTPIQHSINLNIAGADVTLHSWRWSSPISCWQWTRISNLIFVVLRSENRFTRRTKQFLNQQLLAKLFLEFFFFICSFVLLWLWWLPVSIRLVVFTPLHALHRNSKSFLLLFVHPYFRSSNNRNSRKIHLDNQILVLSQPKH